MTVGENIKKLRKEKKLNQRDMAKKLNVANGTISLWENNLRTPSLKELDRIAKCFEIKTIELISDEDNLKKSDVTIKENLTEAQQRLYEKIKQLNDMQCVRLESYADRLIDEFAEYKKSILENAYKE